MDPIDKTRPLATTVIAVIIAALAVAGCRPAATAPYVPSTFSPGPAPSCTATPAGERCSGTLTPGQPVPGWPDQAPTLDARVGR